MTKCYDVRCLRPFVQVVIFWEDTWHPRVDLSSKIVPKTTNQSYSKDLNHLITLIDDDQDVDSPWVSLSDLSMLDWHGHGLSILTDQIQLMSSRTASTASLAHLQDQDSPNDESNTDHDLDGMALRHGIAAWRTNCRRWGASWLIWLETARSTCLVLPELDFFHNLAHQINSIQRSWRMKACTWYLFQCKWMESNYSSHFFSTFLDEFGG